MARQLLKEGWRVRALTRHPSGSAARTLAALGAEIVQADLLDAASLQQAMNGANAVFGDLLSRFEQEPVTASCGLEVAQ